MLKYIAIGVVAVVAVPLVLAAFRPATFRIERSAVVAAPPEKVHALINDIHAFNSWNPFNRKDPAMRGEYRGPAAGPGAEFHFAGNKDVGSGSVSIVQTTAREVTMRLDMASPFEAHNTVRFMLEPKGNTTQVTWAMQGPQPFLGRLVCMFFDMDKMVGEDFESGLASLKGLAELKGN